MRRLSLLLAVLSLLVTVSVSGAEPVHADVAPLDAVHWKVDYDNQTITISVKLRFYTNCSQAIKDVVGSCKSFLDNGPVEQVTSAISNAWNGHYFKCFKVIVNVDSAAAESREEIGTDAVDVDLQYGKAGSVRGTTIVVPNPDHY